MGKAVAAGAGIKNINYLKYKYYFSSNTVLEK